jgi:hypothetical protein
LSGALKLIGNKSGPGPRSRPFEQKALHLFNSRSNVIVDGSSVCLTFIKEGQLKVTCARGNVIIGGAPTKSTCKYAHESVTFRLKMTALLRHLPQAL